VNPECLTAYQELKLGKKTKYIIFSLNKEKTEIVVEKVSNGGDYDDFVEDLPALECRWAVYDLEFDTEEGKRNKLVFVSWYVLTPFSFLFSQKDTFFCRMRTWACDRLQSQVTRQREGQGQDGGCLFPRRASALSRRYRGGDPGHRIQRSGSRDGYVPPLALSQQQPISYW